jgi:hypothetical protein
MFAIARNVATRQSNAMAGLLRFARNGGFLAASLALAACGQPSAESAAADAAEPAKPAPAPAPTSEPFSQEEKTDLIEFDYGWSAEAAAVPELARRFLTDLHEVKAQLVDSAQEDRAFRQKEGFPFHAYASTTAYTTAGQSPRLLSLAVESWEYTGGAHGNGGTSGLLWDRQAKREIKPADLFADPSNRDRLLTQRWCDALNQAREEKRGQAVGGGGMFDDCPGLDDIAILPTDRDKDGRFETLMLVASPYVAGPYVEGSYEIALAVTPDLLAGLKGEYRPSFEVQGRQ